MRLSFQLLSIQVLLSSMLFSSCVKDDDLCCGVDNGEVRDNLVGRWQLVEQKIGIGLPGEWEEVHNGEQSEFFSDLTFSSTTSDYSSGTFGVEGNILEFYCADESLMDLKIVEFSRSSII